MTLDHLPWVVVKVTVQTGHGPAVHYTWHPLGTNLNDDEEIVSEPMPKAEAGAELKRVRAAAEVMRQ